MTHNVKLHESTMTVDEGATLTDVERAEPFFFKTPHGKRETHAMYRGCLIVRNTVQFTNCKPERRTTVYLFGHVPDENRSFTLCCGNPSNVYHAKKMIDRMLATGEMERA